MLTTPKSTFRKDEDGGAALELIIFTPLIMFLFVASLTFFDGYRAKFGAQAATYTIADMVSRETVSLSEGYVDGMLGAFDTLAYRSGNEQLRLSVVQYDGDTNTHTVSWSETRSEAGLDADDALGPLTTIEIATMSDKIPIMGHLDSIVYVETVSDYSVPVPLMSENILDDFQITNSAFVTPRFATTVCYKPSAALDPSC